MTVPLIILPPLQKTTTSIVVLSPSTEIPSPCIITPSPLRERVRVRVPIELPSPLRERARVRVKCLP